MSESTVPLLEAIFEMRWGETEFGQFNFSPDEQWLFPGKISAVATTKGYVVSEAIQNQVLMPSMVIPFLVSHRFRKKEGEYPCLQVGLGVFTVNQVRDNYGWLEFKKSIKEGVDIYNKADSKKLKSISESLVLSLRYQNVFFNSVQSENEDLIGKHFNLGAVFNEEFKSNKGINYDKKNSDINLEFETIKPVGNIVIKIANSVIENKKCVLMDTIVHSKVKESLKSIDSKNIQAWLEQAHTLQKHCFNSLIKKESP